MNDPDTVAGELLEELASAFIDRPRNRQTRIGPSEMGNPCVRAIICRQGGMEEPGDARRVNFKAEVGTMMHAGLAEIFDTSVLNQGSAGRRFLVETPLYIGDIAGEALIGTCDLYDRLAGGVVDHKTAGRTKLIEYRRKGMTVRQKVQVGLYGLGWHRLGMPVNWVGCLYLPRDGEFGDIFLRAEPFDMQVGLAAIARVDGLTRLVQALGIDGALAAYGDPKCGDEWCRWCPSPRRYRPNGSPDSDPFGLDNEKDKTHHA